MKRNYKILLLVGILSAGLWSFIPTQKASGDDKDKMLIELLSFVLEKGHFSPIELNDTFSKKAYASYIQSLDPTKRYFLQSDIDEFSKYENSIDDMIRSKDLTFFDLTYKRLMQRMNEAKVIYTNILAKPLNLSDEESINVDYEKLPYAASKNDLEQRWRKQLEFAVLSDITDKEEIQDAEKDETKKVIKSFEELEQKARKTTESNLNNNFGFIAELTREDWFSIYLNSIVTQYDPHTYYFSPEDKEKFDVSMSGKFEGIGARLQKKNEGIEVSELISGGPAWRGKLLEQGDIIIKVGQGNEEPIDISGMRLDDVIKKIKGPKGTLVKLTVKKVDGSVKVVPIMRDEVETEETFAKSTVVNKDGKLFGVIYLPKFYQTFENRANRDAYKDVALEIERLKAMNVEGIVMDLRDNGGGSLETVVKMTGLFIDKGPVVQVKPAGGKAQVLPDTDAKVQWEGPLVVMINNYSASASEIFAAAIQDYKRGIIIGSKQSYGKGTVQNVFELNEFVRGNQYGDLGALKTTTQKFYRINGGSTQLEGVKSDIVMPDRFSFMETGEKDEKSALPWDKIAPADYQPLSVNYDKVIANSKSRIANNENFNLITENAKWINDRKEDNSISLNYATYKKELAEIAEQTKKFKNLEKYKNNLTFTSLPYELEIMAKDELLKEKRERWHEELSKDVYMTETLNVLSDLTNKDIKTTLVKTKKAKKGKEKLASK
ncbi:carboxyl-terminal processing protease [Flavobacterium urocaniciphilum]|uniref:Carboxyl-terminal processing protease n=2 Tax=Flavobacterium urocaniciphilum TaxID=1299341 RepID=A0A1H9CEA7_9FLAO|nr:carboxyl-terminal processing protease [Flavobacterium urocaniciphilum]